MYTARLTHIISHGWQDYVIEEKDILDNYEVTDDVTISIAVGGSPEEAVRNLMESVDDGFASVEAFCEEEGTEFGDPMGTTAVEDRGTLTGAEWKLDRGYVQSEIRNDGSTQTRWSIFIHEDDDFSMDLWDDDEKSVQTVLNTLNKC
jgi:hypothetical protein